MSAGIAEPPASLGSATPPSGGEIKASSMMARSAAPAAPAAPSAPAAPEVKPLTPTTQVFDDGKKPSEKLFANLRSLAKDGNATRSVDEKRQAQAAKPAEAAKPADTKTEAITGAEGEEGDELVAGAKPEDQPTKPAVTKPEEVIDKKKTNPWKVIDEHKKARATLESEIADLKKLIANPEVRKSEVERLTAAEKRNQELEEHIKFVDYSKSTEFQDKYQKPYEAAWTRAMSELKELTVTDPSTGDERAMSPNDLLELVNMPLLKARETADELYGAAANEVMAYRKEIRGLYEQQSNALDSARKSGVEKSSKDNAARTAQMESARVETAKHWESYNKAILENETTGHYFKPVDGAEEINRKLEAGYKFVDETMALNPLNPKLTPEQRQEAVKRHASLRARAAAFGRMRHDLETTKKELAATLKKLSEFEETVPGTGSDSREAGGATIPKGDRMGGLMQKLRGIAK